MGANVSRALAALRKGEVVEPEPVPELEEPPTPPAPDPRLPLSARQLFNISRSWKGIARAMEPTGIIMFVRLFEANEDILHLFQKFQHERLHLDSMELAQHASVVMRTLDHSIRKLDDVDGFMDYLHAVGKLHRRIPGFRRDYFSRIEHPFLAAVQETLGDRYTENMETIYKITIRYLLNTVVRGFDLGVSEAEVAPRASPEPSPSPQEQRSQKVWTEEQKEEPAAAIEVPR